MNHRRPWALAWIFLAACEPAADSSVNVTVTDSAGVRVVAYTGSIDAQVRIRAAATPDFLVPPLDEDEDEGIGFVRGGVFLSDGRVAVDEAMGRKIRIYTPDGRLERVSGQEGEGPGEYLYPQIAGTLSGDSLVVFDLRNRRISILTAAGDFARETPMPAGLGGLLEADGILPGRQLVLGALLGLTLGDAERLVRDSVPVWILPEGDGEPILVGSYPATGIYEIPGNRPRIEIVPFMAGAEISAGRSGIWVAHPDRFEIVRFDEVGALRLVIRSDAPRVPVTQEEIDSIVDATVESRSADREAGTRYIYSRMPIPEVKPPYGETVLDPDGRLWVKRIETTDTGDSRWLIFEPDGSLWGEAITPSGELLAVSGDRALLLNKDALERESLRLYALVSSD